MDIDEHLDIVIVGLGLSGILAAHIVKEQLPHRTSTIFEARSVCGGTWSFFSFPGVRADSFAPIMTFPWHPWEHKHRIPSANELATYLEDAARADGSLERCKFRHRVVGAEWRDCDSFWRLTVDADGTTKLFTARFVIWCTGYYSIEQALDAPIAGINSFIGRVAHPHWWPKDLDWIGKRVIIVGSGATAFTMAPAMANSAAQVTILQRSPSYLWKRTSHSHLERLLQPFLPQAVIRRLCWYRDFIFESVGVEFGNYFPRIGRAIIKWRMRQFLAPFQDFGLHFNPHYFPSRQRICAVIDDQMSNHLVKGEIKMVTDTIDTVTPHGIRLMSGRELQADIIVTATGLYAQFLNGIKPVVNGKPIDLGSTYCWNGTMMDSLPNMGNICGYFDRTWTPAADFNAKKLIRVIQRMEDKGSTKVVPFIKRWKGMPADPWLHLSSSYIVGAHHRLPKATGRGPWRRNNSTLQNAWDWWFKDGDEGLIYSGFEVKKNV